MALNYTLGGLQLTEFVGDRTRRIPGLRDISFYLLDRRRSVTSPLQHLTSVITNHVSGTLIGTVIDNFTAKLHSKSAYIIPLGLIHIVPGILFIGLFFIPESPRWLFTNGKQQKAEASLRWLRPRDWDVTEELAEMESALIAEEQIQSKIGYTELFRNAIDRRRTTIAVLALTTQAASGAMFVIGQ